MPLPSTLCFVDTETTGGSTRSDRVIEVGVVRVENNQIVKQFQTLIDPQRHLPEEITLLTGINAAQLEAAPTFRQVKNELKEIMDGALMVAHNVRFDYAFLKNEFKLLNENFSPKHFCTVKLSRTFFPQFPHHNLEALIDRFGFKIKNRHRALDDALVLWQFYQKILKEFGEQLLIQAIDKTLKRPTVPLKISQQELDDLPDSPGVYIFYGEKGMPLYVGKSINIRTRVLSYFSADHSSPTEMKISQQVESIETIQTAGELGALFKEVDLIKKLQPLYNRKLRYSRQLIVLRATLNDAPYQTVYLDRVENVEPQNLESVLGIFKSKKDVKNALLGLCKEYELCEKLLGLEKTRGACFGYRLGQCRGACLGKEKAAKYNHRFDSAFLKIKLKPWPFKKAIAIKEPADTGEEGEAYIFDRWVYLGRLKFSQFDQDFKLEKEINFDLDTYKILMAYLRNGKNSPAILPIDLKSLVDTPIIIP